MLEKYIRRGISVKRIFILGSVVAILATSCSGLASSNNSELSDLYGPVTVYMAPT